ncbi:uncharacterized protein LOC130825982 [Amaranthus tricolor]|uniref:uncharacterized protein LOC130825982 n=1 Tax=Amaranthus tricolor TaxID=29722 RepID=UPI002589617B|nr:uncharacterized protein LOC130825982 [Amaranthus tricolor]
MTEKPKKGQITEEDNCTLLQRYPASTILALLREVSQIADVDAKIDWHALVNKTETGITSAREYQILWRHLAYRHPLFDYIAPDEPPIDDDSDLEFEVECPDVSTADALDASNCVKVLISKAPNSRMHNNSSFEVPRISSENPQIQKCSQAAGTFGRGLGENVSTSNIQKKRKRSSEEKDSEPIADVGKGGFKRERSSKRAQKAHTAKKNPGSSNNPAACKRRPDMDALNNALKLALDDNLSARGGIVKISAVKSNLPVTKVTPSQQQPSPVPAEASSEKPAPLGSSSKFCPQKMASTQSSVSADRFQAAHLLPRPAS